MAVYIDDAAAMVALGRRLGSVAQGCSIYLEGELGAGKTTLVRGFLQGMGHPGTVKSPTYTLVEPYSLDRGSVFHLDLYRLAEPEELEYLGIRDLFDAPLAVLVEWPERGAGRLPKPDLNIRIDHAASARWVRLIAGSARGRQALTELDAGNTSV